MTNKIAAPFLSLMIAILTAGALLFAFHAGAAHADSGSGSAVVSATADQLHDPLSSPTAAFDDLVAAKKIGWAALGFGVLLMASRLAGSIGKSVSWLAWLGQGKTAVIVAGAASVSAACYNAVASGGSYAAIAAAAVLALATYFDSHATAASA